MNSRSEDRLEILAAYRLAAHNCQLRQILLAGVDNCLGGRRSCICAALEVKRVPPLGSVIADPLSCYDVLSNILVRGVLEARRGQHLERSRGGPLYRIMQGAAGDPVRPWTVLLQKLNRSQLWCRSE